jgi:hypothetical protein
VSAQDRAAAANANRVEMIEEKEPVATVGFEHQDDAERFLEDLSARMGEFDLSRHPEKTRLIEFGKKAIATRRARALGKPETFDFLGFTHYCATRRNGGGFVLGRTPVRKRDAGEAETDQGTEKLLDITRASMPASSRRPSRRAPSKGNTMSWPDLSLCENSNAF